MSPVAPGGENVPADEFEQLAAELELEAEAAELEAAERPAEGAARTR